MSPSFVAIASAFLPLISLVSGHMVMSDPAPIRYTSNKFATTIDYDYTSPLSDDGSNFPCKGYASLLDTAEGGSVATYAAGSSQTMTITGGAAHNGGSCQASISEDGGATFKVIESYVGNCPLSSGATTLPFTVPAATKDGKVLLAWSWFNKVGNREMYMNCAAVTITGGGSGLSALPDMFEANIGNGCTTVEGVDVEFPNPGSKVTTASSATVGAPVGTCGTASGGDSGDDDTTTSSAVAEPVTTSTTAAVPVTTSTSTIAQAPTSTAAQVPTTSSVKTKTKVPSTSTIRYSKYPSAPAASSLPEATPSSEPESSEGVPECKRSVRYTRSLPVAVQPGCQCTCENNVPKPVCGASL